MPRKLYHVIRYCQKVVALFGAKLVWLHSGTCCRGAVLFTGWGLVLQILAILYLRMARCIDVIMYHLACV